MCAPHTKHFRFSLDCCPRLEFQPGQFIWLTQGSGGEGLTRPYSIASPPRPDNLLELCLNNVEDGALSRRLFELPVGSQVRLKGPQGEFVLRAPHAGRPRDALFVATGTGIAPIRSMLLHLLSDPAVTQQQITLLFGVRHESGILYRDEFDRLTRERANFSFLPTLSKPGTEWQGATGWVQEHVARLLAGRSDLDVYLCGMKAMVEEVAALLPALGIGPDSIRFEKYD